MSWQMSNVKVCTRYRRLEHNESCFGEAGLRSFKMNRVCRNVIVMKQFIIDKYMTYIHMTPFMSIYSYLELLVTLSCSCVTAHGTVLAVVFPLLI